MLKWLVIAAAGYFLFRMFTNDKSHKKHDRKKQQEEKVATGELIKDPVCGTYIDADSGITVRNGDTIYRFCSYECRDTFIKQVQAGANPEQPKIVENTAKAAEEPAEKSAEPAAQASAENNA